MKVEVAHAAQFEVNAPLAAVFDVLADVPRTVGHFPSLDQLIQTGPDVFRWELEPIGVLNLKYQVVYACRYINDPDQRGLCWEPIEDVGNGCISGRWKLRECEAGTLLDFATTGTLEAPIPKAVRVAAAPVVARQFSSQVQEFLNRLTATLNSL